MTGMSDRPISSSIRDMVSWARLSAEVKPMSKAMPWALSLRPAARASAIPTSVRTTSFHPVNRFFRFHSLWP